MEKTTTTPPEPAPAKPDDELKKIIQDTASKAAEWFLVVIGLIYACGFLIVFTFYKSFGINTVDFIEAKYIHIGSLFVMACITIIHPIRWLYVVARRWYDAEEGENKKWVKQMFSGMLSSGYCYNFIRKLREIYKHPKLLIKPYVYFQLLIPQSIYLILNRYFLADWKLNNKHGMHITLPVIGSATLMTWCFLLLLTFASPDFAQNHQRLIFFNLFFPLIIIAVALPAEWIRDREKDYLYPKAKKVLTCGRCFIRFWWALLGPIYLYWFFVRRPWFDGDHNHLPRLLFWFFTPPLVIMFISAFVLFWWHTILVILSRILIRLKLKKLEKHMTEIQGEFSDNV
jgi:hypothetical protein